ncbi:pimeloyl-ACP methyl ester carboxylesterase [Enterococcus sp. PF1-24]|uniref:alpha/beta fold hydrolase n=1 Tax=unclassified Enterococcus TaxID=2608891 RepID=UPI002477161E|nr:MULTISPECIES: alpha/beta hydrolase [unclassified Enterococcus]MDH6365559.1 pimeloyl-ACP methyl ester carboxylesterase [Enterococcus sp. PFB1-1]MDH6402651.1 pimeloyl-ACP methyl ester carboxylesterase [Enterococcus sp. PF1-24]
MGKLKKLLLSLLGLLLFLVIAGFLVIWVNSPGKPPELKDQNGEVIAGSVNEKTFIEVGGIKQGMFIRGEDQKKPVLLYLHGGPGAPEFSMSYAWETQARLEKECVVCYWDQRGTGMSNPSALNVDSLTTEQMIADTVAVTEYLRERFDQEKIYLLGHSWGSYLGIKTVQQQPELYKAYLGVGQVVHQKAGQKLAYDYMKEHAKEIGDDKALKQLATFDPEASAYNLLLEEYGIGTRHDGPATTKLLKNMLFFKGYTFGEKYAAFKGLLKFNDKLDTEEYANDNLVESIPEVEVPIYILQGRYDYQVSYALAKDYCEKIVAPDKKFYTLENSAHSPNLEEPEAFLQVVKEIVVHVEKIA